MYGSDEEEMAAVSEDEWNQPVSVPRWSICVCPPGGGLPVPGPRLPPVQQVWYRYGIGMV